MGFVSFEKDRSSARSFAGSHTDFLSETPGDRSCGGYGGTPSERGLGGSKVDPPPSEYCFP